VALPLAALALALLATTVVGVQRARDRSEARAELGRLEELVERQEAVPAFLLARELQRRLPGERALDRLLLATTMSLTIRSEPSEAAIEFRGYLDDPERWHPLGTTPLEAVRLPATELLFRVRKEGFVPVAGAPRGGASQESTFAIAFELWPETEAQRGFVRVPAGVGGYAGEPLALPPLWLGRYEVTNREYQAFVDAGGYGDEAHWREPFVRDGQTLAFDEAVAEFVDASGHPGPSTWRLGAFPEGEDDHPVTGVSWFEAAAYARWAGAELPSLHHWFRAASPDIFSSILQRANFGGLGTVPVGSAKAIGPFGTHDMAGNAFEWTATGDGEGRRYAAGGAWDEASYTFSEPGAVSPFDRRANRGLRLARFEEPSPPEAYAEIRVERPDFHRRTPVSDQLFAAFRSFYTYERGELRTRVDAVDDASPHFRWELVSYDAAYGGERVLANLLLPRNAEPPYQTVVFFPGSPAERLASSATLDGLPFFEFLVRSGRAVLYPVYKNTFERRIPGWTWSQAGRRDVLIQWSKDLGRSLDYLATRPDIDQERFAFYGLSLGAVYGPVLVALEPRLRAVLLLGGGVNAGELPPEADPINFAPRVKVPTLLLTGRDDFVRPVATHQEPLLRLLGVPEEEKKLAQFDGGHIPSDMNSVIREANAWLDRWLGPVNRRRLVWGRGTVGNGDPWGSPHPRQAGQVPHAQQVLVLALVAGDQVGEGEAGDARFAYGDAVGEVLGGGAAHKQDRGLPDGG
jgi:eukaryotic-like serine/threonine-protein kinase